MFLNLDSYLYLLEGVVKYVCWVTLLITHADLVYELRFLI